ncbi:MAG: class I SAM-dependent methyltransferase [Dermatophilaceae bacterium]
MRLMPAMSALDNRLDKEPQATVRRADATCLPCADGSFDVVLGVLMLHHVLAWRPSFAETTQVLRRGGLLVGDDLVATPLTRGLRRADRSPHRLIGPNELEPALRRGGLVSPQIRTAMGRQAVRSLATKPT